MLPKETLLDILANLGRRDFDVLELVSRALGSLIAAKFNETPRRAVSLMFYEEGHVMATCPSVGWRRLLVIELPQHLPRSVIMKVTFKSLRGGTFTEEMYQALLQCRARFDAGSVCDLQHLSAFSPDMLYRALTEVFMCSTLIFANFHSFFYEQSLTAFPCIANCASLHLDMYRREYFDADGALEWLLGSHGVDTVMKHLCIREMASENWVAFLVPFIVAIEQQFAHASTPTSFSADLLFYVECPPGPAVGTTRELENFDTNELLTLVVDNDVRKPNGEPARKMRVIIDRKPAV